MDENGDRMDEVGGTLMADAEKELFRDVREILNNARKKTYNAINSAMVEAYWNIGKLIVEKQGGAERAVYGDGLIVNLSKQLAIEYGKGFDERNLRFMRQFYLTLPNRNALRTELSWTHYRMIMRVEKPQAREYYLRECAEGNWSTRQLERQINSFCYERVLASRDKEKVRDEIIRKEPAITPADVIKDPYILDFAGLPQGTEYLESELESALISHLQKFLLELGRGFTFEARQKRISLDGDHFYIDLVFYNYILKCFVIVDLKAGKLTHQDIGQMRMYVNYYTRELMNDHDNHPIGIILCADRNESVVRYTFPKGGDPQIFTSKYKLCLPTEEELAREIDSEKELIIREKILHNGTESGVPRR
ncbi:MAG: PDDEXK nuclease domain-containing protein [Methanomassiliicoccaceae archaeon]|jgi:predicted nuclease of restriction endonuclease-like (RecB) superfamily|nr:PDDEXK nuclease domain-containing protein [Methanomassiliicoccaceae archaeon]